MPERQPSIGLVQEILQDMRQERLSSCQAGLSDRQQELTAVGAERDAAVAAVHGGKFWHRLAERARWLTLGVGIGVGLGKLGARR